MKNNLTNSIAITLTFLILSAVGIGYATRAEQQVLTPTRIIIDEASVESLGPMLGSASEEFRSLFIKRLQKRGDVEFVSGKSDFDCRILHSIAPIRIDGKIEGWSVAVVLLTRKSKDVVRIDLGIFNDGSLDNIAKLAAKATAELLHLPEFKDEDDEKGIPIRTAPVVTNEF